MGKANNKKEGITMKLGFIGTGNMASAIMGGIIKNQIIPANDIYKQNFHLFGPAFLF